MDWASIAKASPVIVIYMAMSRLAVIAELLMQAGRSADEPVAIVTHATTPRQRIATGRWPKLQNWPNSTILSRPQLSLLAKW